MRDVELVEVVDVGNAEIERGQEHNLLFSEVCEEMQWDHERAPDDLFANRALWRESAQSHVLKMMYVRR